jgi:hypothetical protein
VGRFVRGWIGRGIRGDVGQFEGKRRRGEGRILKLGDGQSANIALTKGMHDHTTKKKNHSINNKLQ